CQPAAQPRPLSGGTNPPLARVRVGAGYPIGRALHTAPAPDRAPRPRRHRPPAAPGPRTPYRYAPGHDPPEQRLCETNLHAGGEKPHEHWKNAASPRFVGVAKYPKTRAKHPNST